MQPMVFTSQINPHIFVCTAVIAAVKYFHLGFVKVSEQAAVVSRRIANDGKKDWELKMRTTDRKRAEATGKRCGVHPSTY